MREAAGSAVVAARSIAQMVCRVDIAFETLILFDVRVAEPGKVRVNRVSDVVLLAETARGNQAEIRSALLSIRLLRRPA